MDHSIIKGDLRTNDNKERVYVDWPDTENDEFRFISSRMEDRDSDIAPLFLQKNPELYQNKNFDIDQLKYIENLPIDEVQNSRYEDFSRKKIPKKLKNSSVPPLDLISQNSSLEIPGAKGIIDIDLRSSSESLSNCSEEYNEQYNNNFDRDSLEIENVQSFNSKNHPLLNTTLPDVKHSDLVLNPSEYDSSRNNQANPGGLRKLSEISVSSQYRTESIKNERTIDQRKENERAAFEAAKQRHKQPSLNQATKSDEGQTSDFTSNLQLQKPSKSKPTMLVAPQIKQPLYNSNNSDKPINFIELNKNTSNSIKPSNQCSYTSKFIDRHRRESPKAVMKKSESYQDSEKHFKFEEKSHSDQNPEFSSEDFINKKVKSVEKISNYNSKRETNEFPYINLDIPTINNTSEPLKLINPSHILYAYNQYGEPVIINAENIIISNNNNTKIPNSRFNSPPHSNYSEGYVYSALPKDAPAISSAPSPNYKISSNNQEYSRFNESEFVFKEALVKRQPTLYDETLLMKKLKDVKTERHALKFPPIPKSSDSSTSQIQNYGYAANHRRKESNYEQYSLRDFRNIKKIDRVGGLGPNFGTEAHKIMKEKLVRQTNYSKAVQDRNRVEIQKQNEKVPIDKPFSPDSHLNNAPHSNEQESSNNFEMMDKNIPVVKNERDTPTEIRPHLQPKTVSSASKDPVHKREAMLNYAKLVQEKQIKKKDSKSSLVKSQSAIVVKEMDKAAVHELIKQSDLDRLLQRHENDKKMADQIRMKYEKIS